ncbi:MAG: lamin tail domain-containing protein [Archangiaceae bacterium]|nr:lamin tail domain-containing protein [Archangiaceae bacterium]
MGSLVAVGAACGPGGTSTDACKGRMAGDLVITEFLADPDGTDTGSEWIEVFNTLGTAIDLKGVSIYVKKTDGSSLKTHVIKAGKIEPRSYFVLGDVRSGALPSYINYSYEAGLGALSNSDAVIGLKCGTTITFDELQYSVAAKAAHARQLDGKVTPDGTANDDETRWCDAKTMLAGTANFGTPGQANDECDVVVPSGNCTDPGSSASRPVVPPLPGQVFFTEVMADPSAASDSLGEYLEVKSTADVDLNDMVLTVGTTARAITSTQCLRVPAGSYAVLAHETDAGVNGGIPNVVATFTAALTQGAGSVTLSVEDAGIDTANYPASVSGVAWQLDPTRSDATNNDDPSAYCASTVRYGDATTGDFGTPGAANTACMASTAGMCRDMGTSQMRAIVPPSPGSLYFTEVMADPKAVADNLGEWLELKSDGAADLNGLVLTAGSTRNTLSSPDCLAVPAGGYALLAHTASGNGGLPTLTGTFTAGLSNSSTMLSIALPDAGLIDATAYPAAVAGVAWQLSPASSSAVGNDDPMSFCRATVGYPMDGGDLGTPGGANTACPAPPNPNDCVDPGSGMTRAIVKPTSGQLVITEFMADPRGTDDTTGEYIELLANASFDLNGLVLANESTGMSPVSSQTCLPVNAGQFALFARTMDPILNGGLPTPVATFGFTLTNSGVRSVVVRSGTDTLDSFGYGTTTSGASWQLRAGLSSPSDNEDAGSVCITPSARYGHFADGGLVDGGQGDRGTPGTVNENCP